MIHFVRARYLVLAGGILLVAAHAATAADLSAELKAVKQVAGFGKGNAAAAQAWKGLAQRPASDIPSILAGMDDANALAVNWCRAAVDAIAERELRAGGKLPQAQLEKFVNDKKHSSHAREVAFDWLARVDATAPDRLIPGMLNDPALPFRRQAVARLIEKADAEAKENKDQALPVYQQAFEKAHDIDQVKDLATKLKEAGKPVNVTDHLGFIMQWKLIGPFDNTALKGFEIAYPPETKVDLAAKYPGKSGEVAWVDHESTDEFGLVDLNKALGKANGVVAYAWAEFESPDARDIEIRTGTGNANKVWLNGQLLTESRPYHGNDDIDQYVGRGKLKRGKNQILLKVLQNEQTETWAQRWEFQCRACDALGTAVLSANRPPTKIKPSSEAVSAAQ